MNGPKPIDYPDYLEEYKLKVAELQHENIQLKLSLKKMTEYASELQATVQQQLIRKNEEDNVT